MPRFNADVSDTQKTVVKRIADQTDRTQTDIARELIDILGDLDADPDVDDPVTELEHLVARRGELTATGYDPDAPRTQPLTDSELKEIIDENPAPEINPQHVDPANAPWRREAKAKVIASIVRYRSPPESWGTVDVDSLKRVAREYVGTDAREVREIAVESLEASQAAWRNKQRNQREQEVLSRIDDLESRVAEIPATTDALEESDIWDDIREVTDEIAELNPGYDFTHDDPADAPYGHLREEVSERVIQPLNEKRRRANEQDPDHPAVADEAEADAGESDTADDAAAE